MKTDTLNNALEQAGINVESILVYDTIPHPDMENQIAELSENFQSIPEYIVFFSPSGLNSSINYLKKIPDFNKTKVL